MAESKPVEEKDSRGLDPGTEGTDNAKEIARLRKLLKQEKQKRRTAEVKVAQIEQREDRRARASGKTKLTHEQQGALHQLGRLRRRGDAPSRALVAENARLKKINRSLAHDVTTNEDTARKGYRDSQRLNAMNLERDQALNSSEDAVKLQQAAEAMRNKWIYATFTLAFLLIVLVLFNSPKSETPVVDAATTVEAAAPKVEVRFEGDIIVVKTNFEGAEKMTGADVFILWYERSHRSENNFALFGQPQGLILPDGTPRVIVFATRKTAGLPISEVLFKHAFQQNE